MKLIPDDTHYDFLGKWKIAALASGLTILAGIVAYFPMGGLNYGIDFRGGTLVQVRFDQPPELGEIRNEIADADLGPFSLQSFGGEDNNEVLITLAASETEQLAGEGTAQKIEEVLKEHHPNMQVRRIETVGPRVGEELKTAASEAILFSLVAILLYVWVRFQWRYGVAAVAALLHDVLVVLATFVWVQHEITLPVVAAVLTVAGYSINDTIVILDRVRDNVRKFQKKELVDILNESVNQTLSRTLLTSGTTLAVILAIYLFGGEIIRDFAFALLVGIAVGTYSSIFVASPLVLGLNRWFPPKLT